MSSRERFEAWAQKTFVSEALMLAPGQGRWPYAEQTTLFMLDAWQAAYRAGRTDGQEAMRERAAKECDTMRVGGPAWAEEDAACKDCADAIRALPVED
jgi:hypothetical protein